jgi:ADP-heptose:LPS heptosyltransferase
LTVITDAEYMAGGMAKIFEHMPLVDRVECIPAREWATQGLLKAEPPLAGLIDPRAKAPPTVAKADLIYDCNGAYVQFERDHAGNPPYGIPEFWLRYHDLWRDGADLRPFYQVMPPEQQAVQAWLGDNGATSRPLAAIVLRAASPARDWNFDGRESLVADYLYTSGYQPVSVDFIQRSHSRFALSCVGRPLDFVAALLARCSLVITPDTGLLHLAEAVGTRTVALWGIMRPELRVQDYNTVVVPKKSLGFCDDSDSQCKCSWKFQKWSCLHRLSLSMICDGIREASLK